MSHRPSGLLAGALAVLLLLVLAPAAPATPAAVRVVGDVKGIDTTAVDTTGQALPGGCAADSAGEALDKAVNGDWDRMAFVSTILGETHVYEHNDYWSFWINDTYATKGLCEYTVQAGDRILLFVQRDDAFFAGTIFPLVLAGAPASVVAGQPFTVTVTEQQTDGLTTTPVAAAGVTVAGGGASAQTNAAGQATLTLPTPGQASLRATRTGNVSSAAAAVAVTAPAPSGPADPPPPPPPPPIAMPQPPGAAIVGIAEGRRFPRGAGPRELRVKVSAGAGLRIVKLRLTRNDRGRCSTFSGKSERFRHVKCGAANGFWFAVGDRQDTSYLLPSRLPRGRYVLDVNAIDMAYRRDDARRRGGNRIVFHVG